MAIPGHRNEASVRNYIGPLRVNSSELAMLSNESSGRRYEPTAAEFYSANIPRNLHVPVNSAVFDHEDLEQFVS